MYDPKEAHAPLKQSLNTKEIIVQSKQGEQKNTRKLHKLYTNYFIYKQIILIIFVTVACKHFKKEKK